LQSKYSIRREDTVGIRDWSIFYATLATPTQEELRGQTIMVATQAIGWSGVFAATLVAQLVNIYYLSFSLFLILIGLIHDFYLVRSLKHPVSDGLANIRGMLRSFDSAVNPSSADK
jgi:hypothetical protein